MTLSSIDYFPIVSYSVYCGEKINHIGTLGHISID